MIEKAINKILELAEVENFVFDDRQYTSKKLHPVLEPEPECLQLNTLTGFVDYVQNNEDALIKNGLIAHVEGYGYVQLLSGLIAPFLQRLQFISARHSEPAFVFGQWFDVETFIINVQSQFIQDAATAEILKLVGNLKDESVRTVTDDGVTQNVTAKVGVARVNDVDVPNPIALQPYRTFLEIEQPASQFVFRLRRGREGQLPTCALFEADGGKWKLEAILSIRDYLKEKLPEITIIA